MKYRCKRKLESKIRVTKICVKNLYLISFILKKKMFFIIRNIRALKRSVKRHYILVLKFSVYHGYSYANLKQFKYLV
jgi:hypothetical protein